MACATTAAPSRLRGVASACITYKSCFDKHSASQSSQSSRRSSHVSKPSLRNGQFLGRGASKRVVARIRSGTLVAVMTSQTDDLETEAMLMMKLTLHPHPHLLPLLGIEYDAQSRVSMVAPIAPFGSMCDLADHLEFDGLSLSSSHVAVAVLQVLSGLLHLNSMNINHKDVCARNTLVFEFDVLDPHALRVCLADYGEAVSGQSDLYSVVNLARELHALVPR